MFLMDSDTASGSNKLVNKGKTKNGVKISEDELILRRKRQTAQRVRAYRERKKALGFQSSSQAKLNSEPPEKIIRLITDAMSNTSRSRPEFNTSIVQSGEHVSENIVSEKILHQKQLNAERCRRYRQKCKRLKSGASSNQGTSDSDTSTSQDTSFPANKERHKTWNIVCNINENDTLKIKDPRICQLHVSEGSLDSEKSSSKVYLKKDAIPNKNLLPSKNMRVSDESNLEILPYMDSSEDEDAHLATELKQEPDDFFIEEQKFETEDHFFPNVIIEETWKNENDYNQISTEIKNELVSIKQENDTQENQNIIKEEKIYQKINIKQELLEEDTLNDQSNAIGRMDIVSSIKQEINIDSSTDLILKESIDSIKKECNISGNSYLNDIENRLDYVRGKWIRIINLSGSSLKVMNKKYFNPSTGIYICAVCGNLYTKQLEFSYHTLTKHHLKQKKLYKTKLDQKDTGTTILNKDENELKEEMEDNSDEIVNATTGENEFNCEVCLKSFSQKDILNQHLLLLHQGRKRYKCDFCTNSFAYKCNLNKHLLRHAGKPFKCDICIKSFFQKSHLDNHFRFHTGEKPFNCNVCFKSFAHTDNLNKHKRSHRGKKVFNCEICMKSFLLKCNLNMHMRLHTGETPFKCDVCPKSFPRKDSLNTHLLCHTGGKPFQCDICFKNFTRKNAVIRHLRCHTGEKPFKCEVCLNSYSEKRSLIKHIRCHTGEKPFNCDICLKSFPQKGNLKKHLRSHTGETPFKCDICLKCFTRRNTLNRHLYSHTEKRTI